MSRTRLPLAKSRWFVMRRDTGIYRDYGFASKAEAIKEVEYLNGYEEQRNGFPFYAVSPTYRPPNPAVVKGEKP